MGAILRGCNHTVTGSGYTKFIKRVSTSTPIRSAGGIPQIGSEPQTYFFQ